MDELDTIANTPVVDVTAKRVSWLQLLLKRLMDLVLGVALLALFSPFILLVTVLIRMTAGAPAILKEDRVGRDGTTFQMYRFKTTPDKPPVTPPEGDRAYTAVGRFLVKANLDELPQLLNVLKNDMSLVGPRPEYVSIVRDYEAWQRKRFSVKPGITGLWQIVGRKDLFMHRNLEYDFFYIKNQSLLLDILILLKTIRSVLFARGLA
jgi:lipopolysaccharide/colanic/teichoic acid biosynthesis glycosyltransferase